MLARMWKRIFPKSACVTRSEANRYALGKRAPADYLEQFQAQCMIMVPSQPVGVYRFKDDEWIQVEKGEDGIHFCARAEHGAYKLEAADYCFDIYLDSEQGLVDPQLSEIATSVVAQLVAMDEAARTRESTTDYQEQLAYVDISADTVERKR